MRQIWDFNGGIHPPEHKSVSNQNPIQSAGIPGQLVIPLQQHIGGPADPLVKVGDTVLKGQKLAEPLGFISAAVHAPTSGTITDICDLPVAHPSGMTDRCIVLVPDGNEQWVQLEQRATYTDLSPNEILHIIRDKGIAGMGGAGFPTEVKLHPPKQDKVKTLILNGAECEPYITADDMLMRERAKEIVLGLEIMAFILEPDECLIGIEDNKPEAIDAMRAAVAGTKIQVVVIPTKYPSGGEKQLIKILTGQEVPSGSIPADVGVMCQNVATAAAIYRAVYFDEPLISRIITLTGDALQQPGNYEILIGSQVGWLLELAGAREQQISRTIMGGPMMGFTIQSADVPAIKTSNCIIAGTREELPPPPPAQACICCGICVE
ncbi:MAG: electron transport complex subunit RsxC, partial [Pseudomonadales bacterium]|nr:electron transport complex subunit RsxC [Pseudomonadales bacterium]